MKMWGGDDGLMAMGLAEFSDRSVVLGIHGPETVSLLAAKDIREEMSGGRRVVQMEHWPDCGCDPERNPVGKVCDLYTYGKEPEHIVPEGRFRVASKTTRKNGSLSMVYAYMGDPEPPEHWDQ